MTKKKLITGFFLCLVLFSALFFLFRLNWRPQSEPIPLLPLVEEEDTVPANGDETPILKGVQVALVGMDHHLNWKLTVEQVIEEGGLPSLGSKGVLHGERAKIPG